jgi:hypothetical protein
VADADEPQASERNAETFMQHLKEFERTTCTAFGHALHLRPLIEHLQMLPIIISINGDGYITSVQEVSCDAAEPKWQRVYLVNVLSGEPNEHFAALIPRDKPPKAPTSKPSKARAPAPAPPQSRRKGPASIDKAFTDFPWLRRVEKFPDEDRYYCIYCAEDSRVSGGWGDAQLGIKCANYAQIGRHMMHQEGTKWVHGPGRKHREAEEAYLAKHKEGGLVKHDIRIPAMSQSQRVHLRHIITTTAKVTHFLAEYELPMNLARPVCDLIADCAPRAPSVAEFDKYQNRAQATAIVEQLGDIVQEQLIASIRTSPLFGVGFDESTDLGDRQNMALIFSWIEAKTFRRLESFVHLEDLQGNASGESLTSAITSFLQEKGLDLR